MAEFAATLRMFCGLRQGKALLTFDDEQETTAVTTAMGFERKLHHGV
jgi:hypothetical protein